jgi:isopenicillin-N N-acyltransferase like protein
MDEPHTRCSRRRLLGVALIAGPLVALEPLLARGTPSRTPPPFPEVEAAGSPGEIGLRVGRALAGKIRRNVEIYRAFLSKETGARAEELEKLALSFGPVVGRHHPDLLEEMDGIARGAGLRSAEILLLNARTDLLILARRLARERPGPAPAPAVAPPKAEHPRLLDDRGLGCTALALVGHEEGRELLALGQTWDWISDLEGGTAILRLKPARAPRAVVFVEAGMVGKIGFNEARLGVCLNFLAHRADSRIAEPGVPLHVLLRATLSSQSLEEAVSLVVRSPRSASANLLLAQDGPGGRAALSLELTAGASARLPLAGGRVVHANHFKDPALALGNDDARNASSMARDRDAEAIALELAATISDPARRMTRVLASRRDSRYPISKPKTAGSRGKTLAGIVMDLTRNRLLVAAGPPTEGSFVARPGV